MSDENERSVASAGSAGLRQKFFVYGERQVRLVNEREDIVYAPNPHGAVDAFKAMNPGFDAVTVEACPIEGDGTFLNVVGKCEACGITIFDRDISREDEDGVRVCGRCFDGLGD